MNNISQPAGNFIELRIFSELGDNVWYEISKSIRFSSIWPKLRNNVRENISSNIEAVIYGISSNCECNKSKKRIIEQQIKKNN